MVAMSRRRFLQQASVGAMGMAAMATAVSAQPGRRPGGGRRPNILFAIADDWSWPHASAYGATGIQTPAFDRVAREGCLFHNAFCAAPQCSPNRAAVLTGRNIWQIQEAGTHGSIFPNTYPVFTDLLEASGYHIGYTGKPWSPGNWELGGWTRNPAGPEYNERTLDHLPADGMANRDYAGNFELFLEARPDDAPFFFWYGASEPHRRYEEGSGLRAGKRLEDAPVPEFLPHEPLVRSDVLDYLLEVEWFDAHLARILAQLEAIGELNNTLVVVTSDNGMPFPRAKANLYEYGTRVPLAMRWGGAAFQQAETNALFSFIDFAPTFLDLAGVPIPETMAGRSFVPLLEARDPASIEINAQVYTGRERHTHARYDNLGYPSRAIRTQDYLYIRNFHPERWPAGDPPEFHDIDGSPTKSFMLEHKDEYSRLYALAVERRPENELYDIRHDPECLRNLATASGTHREIVTRLRARLMRTLTVQEDPRAVGKGNIFESYPRMSGMRPELGGFAEQGAYNPKYQAD